MVLMYPLVASEPFSTAIAEWGEVFAMRSRILVIVFISIAVILQNIAQVWRNFVKITPWNTPMPAFLKNFFASS